MKTEDLDRIRELQYKVYAANTELCNVLYELGLIKWPVISLDEASRVASTTLLNDLFKKYRMDILK